MLLVAAISAALVKWFVDARMVYQRLLTSQWYGVLQDDLVFLPSKVSSSMGHLGPLVLCTRAMNTLHFMEPYTMRSTQVEVSVTKLLCF